ncbi:uncharacterized protein DNG_06978 [Cephalotrichum gorgonifer]|uniref:RecQ mediated genome instability protein 1 OB-fold domain-containing protein n=1 Tax=Cephalotrichum gorgonifer TaxID=2041049 RepID=A0AAE8N0V5_9PEZI|nr:uncharacterized protein DNG_06978 [Cephalotrichum gorgonifer]
MDRTLTTQLKASLSQTSFPLPSTTLLTTLLSTNPPPSLPRLTAQTKSHILTTDLTTPSLLDPSVPVFPPELLSPALRDAKLPADVPLQIVDIEDLSRSRWDQIEELERIEKGELKKGRAVVRIENEDEDDAAARATQGGAARPTPAPAPGPGDAAQKASGNATHRVTLQDRAGTNIFGIELTRMPRLGVGVTRIGEKVVVRRGATVARGTVLLEPATFLFLGGYVESEEKRWVGDRLKVLREAVGVADQR